MSTKAIAPPTNAALHNRRSANPNHIPRSKMLRALSASASEPDVEHDNCSVFQTSLSELDTDDGGEEAIWAEDVEEAFEEAMTIYPSVGRRKICVDGQMYGRNELIAKHIKNKTGKTRTRKQVSSHIQARAKKTVKDEPMDGGSSRRLSSTEILTKQIAHRGTDSDLGTPIDLVVSSSSRHKKTPASPATRSPRSRPHSKKAMRSGLCSPDRPGSARRKLLSSDGGAQPSSKRRIHSDDSEESSDDQRPVKRMSYNKAEVEGAENLIAIMSDSNRRFSSEEADSSGLDYDGQSSASASENMDDSELVDCVWAGDVEKAFNKACDMYARNGRGKITMNDGSMKGRNELIAEYIKDQTGKERTRKQVSSHIQVLARKGKFPAGDGDFDGSSGSGSGSGSGSSSSRRGSTPKKSRHRSAHASWDGSNYNGGLGSPTPTRESVKREHEGQHGFPPQYDDEDDEDEDDEEDDDDDDHNNVFEPADGSQGSFHHSTRRPSNSGSRFEMPPGHAYAYGSNAYAYAAGGHSADDDDDDDDDDASGTMLAVERRRVSSLAEQLGNKDHEIEALKLQLIESHKQTANIERARDMIKANYEQEQETLRTKTRQYDDAMLRLQNLQCKQLEGYVKAVEKEQKGPKDNEMKPISANGDNEARANMCRSAPPIAVITVKTEQPECHESPPRLA